MKYSTVLFDLDGTLLDTLDDIADAVNHTLARFGHPAVGRDRVRCALGYGADHLLRCCLPEGEDDPAFREMLAYYTPYYEQHSAVRTAPYPGIPELLARLRGAGARCAIISNKPDGATKRLAEDYFPGCFEAAQGESATVRAKPSPDAVLAAMAALDGTRETTVYIGDSEVDVRTGKNAGIPVIGVEWGFRDRETLEREGAEYVVRTAEELFGLCAED